MLLERQLSSAGCSTSYDRCNFPTNAVIHSYRRRTLRIRCSSQPRPYRSSQSPERETTRRHVSPRRVWGSVAASAASVAPPSSYRDGVGSLPPDIITSIPDAIPCLEELEDLRHRAAMNASQGRPGSTPAHQPQGPSGAEQRSRQSLGTAPPAGLFSASPAPEPPSAKPPRPARGATRVAATPAQPAGRSALSKAVPPPDQLSRPQQPRGGPSSRAPGGRHHLTNFSRGRGQEGKQPAMQVTMRIKAVGDWRQLPGLLAGLEPEGLDPFNACAFLTHLAQRVAVAPPASQADVGVIERMQAAALSVVEDNMHEYRGRQVSNMTWALARLGLPSGAAFLRDHLLAAAYPLLPWYEPQHLSNTLWAMAAAGVAPDDSWLEEYLTAAFVVLQRRAFQPQHLANMIWALERLGVMPDAEWMGAYYDCVAAAAAHANAQDCSNILSTLALLGMHEQRPQATAALVDRLAVRLQDLVAADNGGSTGGSGRRDAAAAAAAAAISAPDVSSASSSGMPAGVLTPMPVRAMDTGMAAGMVPEPETPSSTTASSTTSRVVSDQSLANSMWALAVMGIQPSTGLWEGVVAALRRRLTEAPSRSRQGGPGPGVQSAALAILLWAATTLKLALPPAVAGAVYGRIRSAQMAEMEPRSLATMVWAVATAPPEQERPPPEWVSEAVATSLHYVTQLSSQSVSNMLYGLHLLNARPPPVWMSAVINHFHRNLANEASGQSISNVLWCLTKMGYRLNGEGMDILFGLVQARLTAWQQASTGQPQQHQHQQQQLVVSQGQVVAANEQQSRAPVLAPPFNAQEVSNVLYAIAGMGYQTDPAGQLAQLLLAVARHRLPEASPQELSTILWSLATLQIRPSDAWVVDFCAAAEARLPTFHSRDLAQTLYAAAKLRLPLQPTPQPSATTATATTTTTTSLSSSPAVSSWLVAVMAAAPRLAGCSSAQDLCNLSWALVQLRVPVAPDSRLASAFTNRLVALSGTCEASLLALGVWALGKWRVVPTKVQMEELELATYRQVHAMRPHELAAMLSGFAGMRHAPPLEWVEEALQSVAARSKEFGPQDWTIVVHSLSRVQDASVKPELEELLRRLQQRLNRMPLPSLILLAYSCGCVGPSRTARALVERCLAVLSEGESAASTSSPSSSSGAAADVSAASAQATVTPRTGRRAVARAKARAANGEADAAGGAQRAAAQEGLVAAPRQEELAARPVAVSSLSPVELSSLLWSAVRVGIKLLPAEFRTQFLSHTQPLLSDLPASLVSSYLWAAGRLRMWLPTRWRWLLVGRAEEVLADMRGRELGMCMAGLMWLRIAPGESLLRKLTERFEAQRSEMPAGLAELAHQALQVMQRRRRLRLKGGVARLGRRRWLEAVQRGNEAAAAQGKGRVRLPRSEGHVTRRGALKAGVWRRRPSAILGSLTAASPAMATAVGAQAE